MFSAKIFNDKENRTDLFNQTINNLVSYVFEKFNSKNAKVISDNTCIEIASGKEVSASPDQIIVELLIRKNIIINNSDFKDKAKLEKHLSEIRHFCDQAQSIEELSIC